MGRLIVLSGPSCAGKSPLYAAFCRIYPDLATRLTKLVPYNSRSPRPGETNGKTYHFRRRDEIECLRSNTDFVVLEVRGDLQALDLSDVKKVLAAGDAFYEGNPFVARKLQDSAASRFNVSSVFLSPLSGEEIVYLKSRERGIVLSEFLAEVMRRKLLRRTQRQNGILSFKDLENIERRATSAYTELKEAWHFDYVIPNHDGEDSDNWDAFYYPLGDARKALMPFVDLVAGRVPSLAEKWNELLVP